MKPSSTLPPTEAGSSFIPTLNKQGYMIAQCDVYMQAFVDFAAACARPMVDIGAAYGVATLPALARGASVVAVDTDARHLEILRAHTPDTDRPRLTTRCAEFPEGLDFAPASIDAVLIARVLHFFSYEQVQASLTRVFEWLAPGGKLFITADTPYLRTLTNFAPVYEQRWHDGNPWPGHVPDTAVYSQKRSVVVPATMYYVDPDVLRRVLTGAGFLEEKIAFLSRHEYPEDLRLDGRESVGAIVRKP